LLTKENGVVQFQYQTRVFVSDIVCIHNGNFVAAGAVGSEVSAAVEAIVVLSIRAVTMFSYVSGQSYRCCGFGKVFLPLALGILTNQASVSGRSLRKKRLT
jgi:hypothetical protein